jgi:membrane-bound ClpP family serine protease
MKLSLAFGAALLVIAFLVFLFYGNGATGIVLLVLGVIFLVNGGRHRTTQNETPSRTSR